MLVTIAFIAFPDDRRDDSPFLSNENMQVTSWPTTCFWVVLMSLFVCFVLFVVCVWLKNWDDCVVFRTRGIENWGACGDCDSQHFDSFDDSCDLSSVTVFHNIQMFILFTFSLLVVFFFATEPLKQSPKCNMWQSSRSSCSHSQTSPCWMSNSSSCFFCNWLTTTFTTTTNSHKTVIRMFFLFCRPFCFCFTHLKFRICFGRHCQITSESCVFLSFFVLFWILFVEKENKKQKTKKSSLLDKLAQFNNLSLCLFCVFVFLCFCDLFCRGGKKITDVPIILRSIIKMRGCSKNSFHKHHNKNSFHKHHNKKKATKRTKIPLFSFSAMISFVLFFFFVFFEFSQHKNKKTNKTTTTNTQKQQTPKNNKHMSLFCTTPTKLCTQFVKHRKCRRADCNSDSKHHSSHQTLVAVPVSKRDTLIWLLFVGCWLLLICENKCKTLWQQRWVFHRPVACEFCELRLFFSLLEV